MNVRKIDELNVVEAPISYEQYFGEMEISEKEKQDRIKLAYEFEDYLLALFQKNVSEKSIISKPMRNTARSPQSTWE